MIGHKDGKLADPITWMVVTTLFSVGGSILSFFVSSYANNKADEAKTNLQELESRLGLAESTVKNDTEFLAVVKKNFDAMVVQLESYKSEFNDLKEKFIPSTFEISSLTARFNVQNNNIRKIRESWANGVVDSALYSLFEWSEKCRNYECPAKLATPALVRLANNQLTVKFSSPVLNPEMMLMKADPFVWFVKKDEEICKFLYNGTELAVVNRNHSCIHHITDLRMESKEYVFVPADNPCNGYPISDLGNSLKMVNCKPAQEVKIPLQVKADNAYYYVYSPSSTISVNGVSSLCPFDAGLMIPIGSNVTVDGMPITVADVYTEVTDNPDHLKILSTHHILPQPNLDYLKLPEAPKMTYFSQPYVIASSAGGGSCILIIVVILVVYYMKKKKMF